MSLTAQIIAECGHCRRKWMFPPHTSGQTLPCPGCRSSVQVGAPPPPAPPEPDADLSRMSDDSDADRRPRYRPEPRFPFVMHTLSVMCGVLAALLVASVSLCVVSNLLPPALRDVFTIRVTLAR